MSSTDLMSFGTSEKRAPDRNDNFGSQPSSTCNKGVQEPESSNSSGPASYGVEPPLHNPFQSGDGVQERVQSATATYVDPLRSPSNTIVPVPIPYANPFAVETVIAESLSTPPPLPIRPPGLRRGLQIPSRVGIISWGFTFPKILLEHGVTKPQWRRFKHELKAFANMTFGQWMTVIATSRAVGIVFGEIAGIVCHQQMQKHREHENFLQAYQGGLTKTFEDRWNQEYFHPLGLHVRVEPPNIGKTDGMDVASSKLFRYQQKKGTVSPAPGIASKQGDKKEYKYQSKEGRYRLKAVRKCRIIVLPFEPAPSQRRSRGSEGCVGQMEGTTAMSDPQSSDLPSPVALAQDHSWAHQRQAGSENLYRDLSDEVQRVLSPARAATTHGGGN